MLISLFCLRNGHSVDFVGQVQEFWIMVW